MLLPARFARFGLVILMLMGPLAIPAAKADLSGPESFVQSLGEEAIALLNTTELNDDELQQAFIALLDRGFDINTIARFVIGRYWRGATTDQRNEYMVLFREFVLDTYAQRLDEYAGQSFNILDSRILDAKDTVVETELQGVDGPTLKIDYRVRSRDGNYQIIDVMVEGVSLVVTQRSEFASVINHKGMDGLLEVLREYNAQ